MRPARRVSSFEFRVSRKGIAASLPPSDVELETRNSKLDTSFLQLETRNSKLETLFRRRGAALYLTTLSISVMIASVGLTILATQRADRRIQLNTDLENQAW